MTDSETEETVTDVDAAIGEDWEAETTPAERVRSVIAHTYSPVSADAVADDARTSPKTARKHLESLANEGFVATKAGDHGGTTYRRSPESLVVEQAADLLENVSEDELVGRIAEMRRRLREFRTEYDVESPEELFVERTNRTLAETGGGGDGNEDGGEDGDEGGGGIEADQDVLVEWQRTRRNLAFANAALAIANAERFVDADSSTSQGTLPVG